MDFFELAEAILKLADKCLHLYVEWKESKKPTKKGKRPRQAASSSTTKKKK